MALSDKILSDDVRQAADPIARALGLEILDIQCIGRPPNPLVRLVLDKVGGLGIQDCERFHQTLMKTWELTRPRELACRFEVSSPGLDRPLKKSNDFQRVVGNLVKVTLRNPIEKNMVLVGRLESVTETGIHLLVPQGRTSQSPRPVEVEWENIARARLEVEF